MRVEIVAKDIQVALGHFKVECGKLPVTENEQDILRSDGVLPLSLLAEDAFSNPRESKFIDLPPAKNGCYGLTNLADRNKPTSTTALVDPWGERYFIILESTGDGLISNPEYQGGANATFWHKPPSMIRASSLIYSAGPDRDPNTWEDNVCSLMR